MKKEIWSSLTLWSIIAVVFMFVFGMGSGIVWDKQDWIFLFVIVIGIVLNVKLNKLLSKKSQK